MKNTRSKKSRDTVPLRQHGKGTQRRRKNKTGGHSTRLRNAICKDGGLQARTLATQKVKGRLEEREGREQYFLDSKRKQKEQMTGGKPNRPHRDEYQCDNGLP
jgi:hypothetical protein